MPDSQANSDTLNQPRSADPANEGTWQPDLDPDLSAEVEQEHVEYLPALSSTGEWQPPAPATTSDGSVAVEDYHTDPEQELAMQLSPDPASLEERVGQPFIPPPSPSREIPGWVWPAIAAFLIVAIVIFHQAGIYVFFVGVVLIIGIFRATAQSLARSYPCRRVMTSL